jgi:hypothetical protein
LDNAHVRAQQEENEMAIEAADLKLYKSVTVGDGLSNGGRQSYNEVISNQATNLFPNVTQAERTAGITRYRKTFSKVHDDGNETLYNHKLWIKVQTPAGDLIQVKAGTNTDTQAEADDYTGWLGCGRLNQAVSADSTEIEVLFEDASGIQTSDVGWLSDGTNEEFVSVTGVSWVVNTATITLSAGLTYGYSAYTAEDPVYFAGYIDLSDTTSSVDSIVVTSASGTFTNANLTTFNQGTIEDDWQIEMENATPTYKCTGTFSGEIATGQALNSEFKPSNPNVAGSQGYYFQIAASSFGGTWTTGETLDFSTHHASKAVWVKEVVPASTASYSNNNPELRVSGESA